MVAEDLTYSALCPWVKMASDPVNLPEKNIDPINEALPRLGGSPREIGILGVASLKPTDDPYA